MKTRDPEVRTDRWDNEITAKLIFLVNPETNQLYTLPQEEETVPPRIAPPRTKYDILSKLDRNTHRLVQFANQEGEDEPDFIPVCKIVSKKDAYAADRRRKDQQKERKKTEAASKSVKTLELNWAIDPNDLGHRLDKVASFLAEGRKVEVVLASKKKGRKASTSDCEEVLQRIKKTVESVSGSKETKGMEGKLGAFAMLSYQGKMQQQSKEDG